MLIGLLMIVFGVIVGIIGSAFGLLFSLAGIAVTAGLKSFLIER